MSLLDEAWAQREEDIYPELFGGLGEGIFVLTPELFKEQFSCDSIDPTWLNHGVIKFAPTAERASWLYVTSGLSNPWETDAPDAPDEYSGLGMEFVLETHNDESWAIPLLQSILAFNLLLAAGRYGERPILSHGDRIPQTIEPEIASFILWEPEGLPDEFELVSGKVELVQVFGITAAELQYAQDHGSTRLCQALIEHGEYPVCDAERESISLDDA